MANRDPYPDEICNSYRGILKKGESTLILFTVAKDRKEAKINFFKDYPEHELWELTLNSGDESEFEP